MTENFGLNNVILTIDNIHLTGFEGTQDSISIDSVSDDGTMEYGTHGEACWVDSCNRGVNITLKFIQTSEANSILRTLREEQINNPRDKRGFVIVYNDLSSNEKIVLTGCYFKKMPTYARGTSHNSMTWELQAKSATYYK